MAYKKSILIFVFLIIHICMYKYPLRWITAYGYTYLHVQIRYNNTHRADCPHRHHRRCWWTLLYAYFEIILIINICLGRFLFFLQFPFNINILNWWCKMNNYLMNMYVHSYTYIPRWWWWCFLIQLCVLFIQMQACNYVTFRIEM